MYDYGFDTGRARVESSDESIGFSGNLRGSRARWDVRFLSFDLQHRMHTYWVGKMQRETLLQFHCYFEFPVQIRT